MTPNNEATLPSTLIESTQEAAAPERTLNIDPNPSEPASKVPVANERPYSPLLFPDERIAGAPDPTQCWASRFGTSTSSAKATSDRPARFPKYNFSQSRHQSFSNFGTKGAQSLPTSKPTRVMENPKHTGREEVSIIDSRMRLLPNATSPSKTVKDSRVSPLDFQTQSLDLENDERSTANSNIGSNRPSDTNLALSVKCKDRPPSCSYVSRGTQTSQDKSKEGSVLTAKCLNLILQEQKACTNKLLSYLNLEVQEQKARNNELFSSIRSYRQDLSRKKGEASEMRRQLKLQTRKAKKSKKRLQTEKARHAQAEETSASHISELEGIIRNLQRSLEELKSSRKTAELVGPQINEIRHQSILLSPVSGPVPSKKLTQSPMVEKRQSYTKIFTQSPVLEDQWSDVETFTYSPKAKSERSDTEISTQSPKGGKRRSRLISQHSCPNSVQRRELPEHPRCSVSPSPPSQRRKLFRKRDFAVVVPVTRKRRYNLSSSISSLDSADVYLYRDSPEPDDESEKVTSSDVEAEVDEPVADAQAAARPTPRNNEEALQIFDRFFELPKQPIACMDKSVLAYKDGTLVRFLLLSIQPSLSSRSLLLVISHNLTRHANAIYLLGCEREDTSKQALI